MSKLTGKSSRRQQEEVEEPTKQRRRGQAPGRTIESRENQIIRLSLFEFDVITTSTNCFRLRMS